MSNINQIKMCNKCNKKETYKNNLCKECYQKQKVKQFYEAHPEKYKEYAQKKELKRLIREMDAFGMDVSLQEIFLFGGNKLETKLNQYDKKLWSK